MTGLVMPGVPQVPPASQLDAENPWPGLESYDESSYQFFSGRATEAAELLRRIADEPVTVLFGKSGLGKTSLLKAGVFPQLREKDLLPVLIRLQIRSGSDPLILQVLRLLVKELESRGVEHPSVGRDESLWDYLHRAKLEFWTAQNRLVRPVFVFDQFEELFTLGSAVAADVDAFKRDLADLAENRIPPALTALGDAPAPAGHPLDLQAMRYSIVIALREDFLADLEGWRAIMPSLRRNRMRLLPMGGDQAFEAVRNERTAHLVPEPLATRIVMFLASRPQTADPRGSGNQKPNTVEPALLSLFCRGVNEARKRAGKQEFDDALLESGKGTIVADFYRTSLADQRDQVRRFIEEDLVTEQGYRNSFSVEDAVAKQAVTSGELNVLINRHLLRHEHHLGTERVELTHDLLTAAVVEARTQRRSAETLERERRHRWRKLRTVAIIAALLVIPVFAWLAFTAIRAKGRANLESSRARSRELAAIAGSTIDRDPALAIALTREGLTRADTPEARSALLDAARYIWPSTTLGSTELHGTPEAVSMSGDGSLLAVLTGDRASLWNVAVRPPLRIWETKADYADASSVTFSPDQTLVAIGRTESITVLDTPSGNVRLQLAQSAVYDRLLAFSPDGEWLAWAQDNNSLRILDLQRPGKSPEEVQVGSFMGFALHAGGDSLTTVGSSPLEARVFTRSPVGSWTSVLFDLSSCTGPAQSISPGTRHLSATWTSRKCIYPAGPNLSSPIVLPGGSETSDVVWSTGGEAFADLAGSHELLIARVEVSGEVESRIKGEHGMRMLGDMTRSVSVSESADRLAYLEEGTQQVRIISLGVHKPLLTSLPETRFDAAADGSWFAMARSGPGGKRGIIEVVPLEKDFPAGHLSKVRTRIRLDAVPDRVTASNDALIVELPGIEPRIVVYDAATGAQRASYSEQIRVLGRAGDLLLVGPAGNGRYRIVRTRDGSELTAWDHLQEVLVSTHRTAIALLWPRSDSGLERNIEVFSVEGGAVTKTGELLPLAASLSVADDARSLTDKQSRQMYKVIDGTPTGTEPELIAPAQERALSPTRRFELQFHPADKDVQESMTLMRKSDGRIIRRFLTHQSHQFSSDDRWIAVWRDEVLQVIDTGDGSPVVTLRAPNVLRVRFVGDTILRVDRGAETMLVPLDRALMERFTTWLTTRVLTEKERCLFGVSSVDCR